MIQKLACLLDIDGVLVDTRQHLTSTYLVCCESMGLKADVAGFQSRLGLPLEKIFENLHPSIECGLLTKKFRHLAEETEDKSQLFAGISDLLNFCQTKFDYTACVTSKDFPRAQKLLAGLGIVGIDIFSPSQKFKSKPAPDLIFAALKKSGCVRGVFLGDASSDQMASLRAGIYYIHCAWGYGSPVDYLQTEIAEDSKGAIQTMEHWFAILRG